MAKDWIKGAIKKSTKHINKYNNAAGKSISEYCQSPPSTLAKQRCNLAKTLKSFKNGGQTQGLQGCGCPYGMEMGPNSIL